MKNLKYIFFLICFFLSSVGFTQNNLFCDTTQLKYLVAFSPSDSSISYRYFVNSRVFPNDSNMIEETFYKNGVRKSFCTYINDQILNGTSFNYYPNGKIKNISYYIYGLIVGGYSEWYDNGQIKISGSYWLDIKEKYIDKTDSLNTIRINKKNETKISEKTITGIHPYNFKNKDGIWYYYDDKGNLIRKEHWDKGVFTEK
jgi:antitoxin component YwqK of YwqJK toxin-antitoxin module